MVPGVKIPFGVQRFAGELMVSKSLHDVDVVLRFAGLVGMPALQKASAPGLSSLAFAQGVARWPAMLFG